MIRHGFGLSGSLESLDEAPLRIVSTKMSDQLAALSLINTRGFVPSGLALLPSIKKYDGCPYEGT